MSHSNFPLFKRFPGNVVAKPPCKMINANMYGFFVKGDSKTIQAYLDNTLNCIADNEMHFEPLSPYVLLTFTDIQNISSLAAEFSNQGWMQETDIIVWLPVAKMEDGKVNHIYWYPAFICVNNIYALINGINTWGYNKYMCTYEMPEIGGKADYFSMSVDAFQPFTPSTEMANHLLLEVKRNREGEESEFAEFIELIQEAFDLLKSNRNFFNFDTDLLKQLLKGFVNPQMDQILFKQFPDGEGERAVYQGVVHSPSVIKKVHHAKIYKHEYDVILHQVDTFRLDQAFGLKLGKQEAILPFNVLMDFDQQAAYELGRVMP